MIQRNERTPLECIKYELDLRGRIRWLPHNLIAHPLMAILPLTWGQRIHDLTLPKEPPNE